jgi:hypothetical protein
VTEKPRISDGHPLAPPKPVTLDRAHAAAGGVLSAAVSLAAQAPIGSIAAELYKIVVQSGFERRTGEWREVVALAIMELQERFGRLPEDLEKDERFLDAVARAAVAAMKDHRREKWEWLRNALMNAALPGSVDEDVQQHFFQLIDELGVTPVAILEAISNPQDEAKTGEPVIHSARVYEQPVLEFLKKRLGKTSADEPDLCLFLDQLAARGLLPPNDTGPPWQGILHSFRNLTPMGKRFLAFVKSPPPPNAE